MELKIHEDKKNRLAFELPGEDATFCNILRDELWNDQNIVAATFKEDHPLIKTPYMIVETSGSTTPRQALKDAVKRLKKGSADLKKEFEKALA